MNLINTNQLAALFKAHVKELMREPAVLFWGIVFPILMTLGLGLAFTQSGDVERNIAVIRRNHSIQWFQNQLGDKIKKTVEGYGSAAVYSMVIKDGKLGNTTYKFIPTDWKQAVILLKRGEVSMVIDEQDKNIKYNFDPVNTDAQLIYLNLTRAISNQSSKAGSYQVKPLSVTGTRYIDFFVPGLIAMGILMSSAWGISYGLIEKRSKKLLRRMIATPMKKSHFLFSLMCVRTIMNFLEGELLYFFAYLVFGVTITGSIPALLLVFAASNIAFQGMAILMASRTASPEVGNGLINAVVTPMMVLSGIFFSYHNFPDWAVAFIKLLPLTILADTIRSIFIEGAGIQEAIVPVVVLLAMGSICFYSGLRLFRWH